MQLRPVDNVTFNTDFSSLKLSQVVEFVGKEWFDQCFFILKGINHFWKWLFFNSRYTDIAEIYTKSYQMIILSQYIPLKCYVPQVYRPDYLCSAHMHLCGTKLNKCLKCYGDWFLMHKKENDFQKINLSLARSIYYHITRNEYPTYEHLAILEFIPFLMFDTEIAISTFFHDKESVSFLNENKRDYIIKLKVGTGCP